MKKHGVILAVQMPYKFSSGFTQAINFSDRLCDRNVVAFLAKLKSLGNPDYVGKRLLVQAIKEKLMSEQHKVARKARAVTSDAFYQASRRTMSPFTTLPRACLLLAVEYLMDIFHGIKMPAAAFSSYNKTSQLYVENSSHRSPRQRSEFENALSVLAFATGALEFHRSVEMLLPGANGINSTTGGKPEELPYRFIERS